VHAERLEGYQRQHRQAVAAGAGDTAPYDLATLEFGIAYERAVLDWFHQLPPKLRIDGNLGPDPAPRGLPGSHPGTGGRPR
jgi:hypothetical protein